MTEKKRVMAKKEGASLWMLHLSKDEPPAPSPAKAGSRMTKKGVKKRRIKHKCKYVVKTKALH
jgi:hypothetical protein